MTIAVTQFRNDWNRNILFVGLQQDIKQENQAKS